MTKAYRYLIEAKIPGDWLTMPPALVEMSHESAEREPFCSNGRRQSNLLAYGLSVNIGDRMQAAIAIFTTGPRILLKLHHLYVAQCCSKMLILRQMH
jgi:hypothetical protein